MGSSDQCTHYGSAVRLIFSSAGELRPYLALSNNRKIGLGHRQSRQSSVPELAAYITQEGTKSLVAGEYLGAKAPRWTYLFQMPVEDHAEHSDRDSCHVVVELLRVASRGRKHDVPANEHETSLGVSHHLPRTICECMESWPCQ